MLRRILARARCARGPRGDACEDAVYVFGPAPLLVREHVAANRLLLALNEVHICEHTVGFVALGELGCGLAVREERENMSD